MPRGSSIAFFLGALALSGAAHAQGAVVAPEVALPPAAEAAAAEPIPPTAGAAAAEPIAPAAAAATPPDATSGWDVMVLSYGGDSPEEVAASARDAAQATLAGEGYSVLPEAEITARIPPARLRGASSIDALRAIGDELGARTVVTVAVWMSDGAPGSVAISIATGGRSFSGTADVETDLAAAAASAVGAALERQRRALLLDAGTGGSTATVATTPGDDARGGGEGDPWSESGTTEPAPADDGPSELFGIIGPGLLLAIGGAGVGLGIYGLLDTTCTLRGPMTGVCLRGEEPNLALGTLFVVGGSISLIGAVIWWITDATMSNEPRIDIVDLDVIFLDGGALGVARGSF